MWTKIDKGGYKMSFEWDTICENCKKMQCEKYYLPADMFLCANCYHQIKDEDIKKKINFRTIKTCATCAFSRFSEDCEEYHCTKHNLDVECNTKCDNYIWYIDYVKEKEK